mgnify:CR=1 FL=1
MQGIEGPRIFEEPDCGIPAAGQVPLKAGVGGDITIGVECEAAKEQEGGRIALCRVERGAQLPECFEHLRRLLEARLKKHGSREYVQVLRLMAPFALTAVTHAIQEALLLGTISFDAVRHLLLCRIERRPPRLDMQNYPHLPMAQVRTTQAADYMTLLAGVCA